MSEYGCEHCKEVCQNYRINFPSDLRQAIRVVQDNIADGTIIESDFWPDQHLKTTNTPFSEIQSKGPWEDVLVYYFECPRCTQLFKLSAETYHGSGGCWTPIKKGSL
ncbi:hypothetical protein DSCO28_67170 [Desulfosarcina ovata subsp. sediminis]|uniref:Uncharacterized protein n=1 Tax=Desulfosarcina ovata subsp. sediminis TaxID=885957 RepID=A0A5K8A162_9BACT|nr:hypothetical protein DSCO28_67170 [Desulfosarcina ovata subsp. sediminis]